MDIKEVAQRLGKSEITIRRAIRDDKLKAELQEGKYRISEESLKEYALTTQDIALTTHDDQELDRLREENKELTHEINHLRSLIGEKDQAIEERQKRHDEMVMQFNDRLMELTSKSEDAKQRSDTIILQLTRQLEQSQRLLEYHQEPWYKRVFRKRKTEKAEE